MQTFIQASGQKDLFTISPVSFNMRDYDEFSAVQYNDGLVFCSNRTQNIFIARVDSLNMPLLNLYSVKKKETGKWAAPEPFLKEISSRKHEGPFTFSKDYKTLYFTRNEGEVNGIYISKYDGSKWEMPTPFTYNESQSDVGHPCISDDGKRLFFVSNKRGGFGGFDIYVCTWNKNRWSQPKNLGPEVNTAFDELYPFSQANGRLYFSSNRPKGLGGLDIYFSKEKNEKWTTPKPLSTPLNTKSNDFAYWSDSTDLHGFVSSDRSSHSKLCDIYEFTINFPYMNNCKPQEKNDYTYVLEEPGSIGKDSTSLGYEWDFGDGSKIRGKSLKVEHTFPKIGDYNVQLNVIDTITGKVSNNVTSYSFPVADIEQPYITAPETAKPGEEIIIDANKTFLPDKTITNYYWDFGDDNIATGITVKHTYTESGKYRIKLSVSYTKDKGTQSLNDCRYFEILIQDSEKSIINNK